MRNDYLLDGFPGGQFLQDRFDRNACPGDYRLSHHDLGIGNNQLSVIAHRVPWKLAYRAPGAKSFGVARHNWPVLACPWSQPTKDTVSAFNSYAPPRSPMLGRD